MNLPTLSVAKLQAYNVIILLSSSNEGRLARMSNSPFLERRCFILPILSHYIRICYILYYSRSFSEIVFFLSIKSTFMSWIIWIFSYTFARFLNFYWLGWRDISYLLILWILVNNIDIHHIYRDWYYCTLQGMAYWLIRYIRLFLTIKMIQYNTIS